MHELIAQTINFVIVVGLLVYIARKPLKAHIAQRSGAIKAQVDEANLQKLDAEKKFSEFSQKLDRFEAEASTLLERAKTDGEALKARIIEDAKTTAERIIREAEATAAANTDEYRERLTRETIAKAVTMAEELLRQRLSQDDLKRLVSDYVKGVQNS